MSNLLWNTTSPGLPASWTPPSPGQMKLELVEQLLLATREDLLRVKVDLASALRRIETLEKGKLDRHLTPVPEAPPAQKEPPAPLF